MAGGMNVSSERLRRVVAGLAVMERGDFEGFRLARFVTLEGLGCTGAVAPVR